MLLFFFASLASFFFVRKEFSYRLGFVSSEKQFSFVFFWLLFELLSTEREVRGGEKDERAEEWSRNRIPLLICSFTTYRQKCTSNAMWAKRKDGKREKWRRMAKEWKSEWKSLVLTGNLDAPLRLDPFGSKLNFLYLPFDSFPHFLWERLWIFPSDLESKKAYSDWIEVTFS